MFKLKRIIILPAVLMLFLLNSCQPELETGKYERPEWLAGKVYTQILEQTELSTFAQCVEIAGYDTVIDVSGSWTVFAPSNEAFEEWLTQNEYSSVDKIPKNQITRLVEYHLVQNPWSKSQLRSLDIYGWIDTLDITNKEPGGFKRETILREKNRKYGLSSMGERTPEDENLRIVDTSSTSFHRKVLTDSRKFVPFFYKEYFDIYDLTPADYEFYFDRAFTGGTDIYFAGAKLGEDEIFAENGFLYVIDKVVDPLESAYQILENEYSSYSYSHFLDLINRFPEFNYNQEKTLEQPGAEQGLVVDSLFNLNFPELLFNVASESTSPLSSFSGPGYLSIRYHHGMMAPTNEAFEDFIKEYIEIDRGWGSFDRLPNDIKSIVANSYLSASPVFPTNMEKGFYNGERDLITIDESSIIQKQFGSNSTFIGLSQAIVPGAFSSVAGPVYLQPGYQKVMFAIEEANLLSALKRKDETYMFFVESDVNTLEDESLLYPLEIRGREYFFLYKITKVPQPPGSSEPVEDIRELFLLEESDLRTLILNHIATGQVDGVARKEFIPNMAGNYIIVNNETGEFKGTASTTKGYKGDEEEPVFPKQLSMNADNGTTYEIQNWFSFSAPTLFSIISSSYPKFHSLLKKAGLTLGANYFNYPFISNNELYTVFIPSDDAIANANLDDMPVDELRNVLLTHFVVGDMIFTDGKRVPGYYKTAREDERSTEFVTVFTDIWIEPGIDVIRFRGKDQETYAEIYESAIITNQMAGVNTGDDDEVFRSMITNAVVHEIDEVLIADELDTN